MTRLEQFRLTIAMLYDLYLLGIMVVTHMATRYAIYWFFVRPRVLRLEQIINRIDAHRTR